MYRFHILTRRTFWFLMERELFLYGNVTYVSCYVSNITYINFIFLEIFYIWELLLIFHFCSFILFFNFYYFLLKNKKNIFWWKRKRIIIFFIFIFKLFALASVVMKWTNALRCIFVHDARNLHAAPPLDSIHALLNKILYLP